MKTIQHLHWTVAVVRLVDHQVWSLYVQDGFVPRQRCQVLIADDAVLHSSLGDGGKGGGAEITDYCLKINLKAVML